MNNVSSNPIESLTGLGIDVDKLLNVYPHLLNAAISLKAAGISKRHYSHWKKEGLIDASGVERQWTKLNLIDFMWIKIVSELRLFGIPIPVIKKTKTILFTDTLDTIRRVGTAELMQLIDAKMEATMASHYKSILESTIEFEAVLLKQNPVLRTLLMSVVGRILLAGDVSFLIISNINGELTPSLFSPNLGIEMNSFDERTQLKLPLNDLLKSFFTSAETQVFAEAFGLLSQNEISLLQLINEKPIREVWVTGNSKTINLAPHRSKNKASRAKIAAQLLPIMVLNEYETMIVVLPDDQKIRIKVKVDKPVK
jgi:hypothetical protein